jgi:hypothetical protein
MKNSYFVQWVNSEGVKQVPVLANDCHSFEEAAAWAVAWDLPHWATDKTAFFIYAGRPDPDANFARFTVGKAKGG